VYSQTVEVTLYLTRRQGDNFNSQIKTAIELALVHVEILSPRYAESHWCLEDLHNILKTDSNIILMDPKWLICSSPTQA
jgi:hypothetical protein